jgi:hypothetical protein
MLNRLLRSAINAIILLAMTVAGLPVIVCVSQAHGVALEFNGLYANHHGNSQTHPTIFGAPETSVASEDCSDFRLDRGVLVKQIRVKHPSTLQGANNDSPTFATFAPSSPLIARRVGSMATSWVNCPVVRSSLSDLSTIVLLI